MFLASLRGQLDGRLFYLVEILVTHQELLSKMNALLSPRLFAYTLIHI